MKQVISQLFRVPKLTRLRMFLAVLVAVFADTLQFLLSIFGWWGIDQTIDAVALVLTTWLIGFHFLLMPTFALELIPIADELPTWTACVVAVIALRKRAEESQKPTPRVQDLPAIDI